MRNNNDKWGALSIKDRASLIDMYLKSGIKELSEMKKHYNGVPYRDFNTSDYDYFNASPEMIPTEEGQHWDSRNPHTGQILKSENHPTFDLAVEGEKNAGYKIVRGYDGNLYSIPNQPDNYVEKPNILDGTETEQTTTSESPSKKHVEDVIRTTRGATGKFISSEYPYVDTGQLRYLMDSWKVMRGNNDYIAPKDDNYTGTAIKDGKLQTDNGLGFATQKELEDKLGYIPKDFVDTYVYGDIPFEELGVFKKDVSPERHVLRSKVEKVEKSGKNIKTYQTHKDTLDSKKVAYFDKLLNEGLVDLHSRNTTTQDSPFRIGDSGIIYDGNNSTIATVYLPNGQPVSKAIDVFDTDPTEWNYNVGPLAKTGLKFIHDNTNPFIMTTPWYYPEGSSDEADRLENLFGIVIDPDDYYVYSNKGDKNGVKWTLDEAVDWIRSHPDLTEMPKKSKKSKEKFGY